MSDSSRYVNLPDYRIPARVLADIEAERDTQDARWGEQNHDDSIWALILGEEFGEVQQAILEARFGDSERGRDAPTVREELVQAAAVAVAWIEAVDRRGDAR